MLYIKNCEYGRGLFAKKNIEIGTLIESSPVLFIPKDEEKIFDGTILVKYLFSLDNKIILSLGMGSLFNHSENNNVYCKLNKDILEFYTTREVLKDEQLFINYGYNVLEMERTYYHKKKNLLKKIISK